MRLDLKDPKPLDKNNMHKTLGVIVKGSAGLAFMIAALALPSVSWAGIAACTAPQTLDAAISGSTSNGCSTVDNNFVNFNVTESGTTTSFPAITTGTAPNIEFTEAGTTTPALPFVTTGQTASGTGDTCTANSWCEAGNGTTALTGTQNIFYDVTGTSVTGLSMPTIPAGSLNAAGNIRAGDVVSVQEDYCLGAITVTGCTDLGYIKVQATSATTDWTYVYTVCTAAVTCIPVTSTTVPPSITFASQTSVAVEDIVQVSTIASEGRIVFLDGFTNDFTDSGVPEPSTFVLLGSALAGLGFLRFRRRKA